MQDTSNLHHMIAAAIERLPAGNAAARYQEGRWRLRDGALLHVDTADDEILIALSMPETHLDLQQLEQLLLLCGQGWPAPLAASLNADETQALLFVRLEHADLEIERVCQAVLALHQARGRWLRPGAAR